MKITIYTSNGCGNCNVIKQLLKAKAIDFEEVNVSQDASKLTDFREAGVRSMPVLEVEDLEAVKPALTSINDFLKKRVKLVLGAFPLKAGNHTYMNLQNAQA